MKTLFEVAAACAFLGMIVPAAEAHEFWIEGQIDPDGATLTLDLKVGQNLDGVSLPYFPETVSAFHWVSGGKGDIVGQIGEIPSARLPFDSSEGAVVFHRTKPRQLVHSDPELFQRYLDMEGLHHIPVLHAERGLPPAGFVEEYSRHAKLYVSSANEPTLQDAYQGSPVEFVVEQIRRQHGSIRINARLETPFGPSRAQVTVFAMGADGVKRRIIVPDQHGRVDIQLQNRDSVLLNAVIMRPLPRGDAVWSSDWASLRIQFSNQGDRSSQR